MYGQLIPVGGGDSLPLFSQTLIVGRHPNCDLSVASRSVSGRHCELKHIDGCWWVRDLDSQNGTGVNGKRCQSQRLLPDDTLHVARLRFKIVYEPARASNMADSIEDFALRLLGSDPLRSTDHPSGNECDRESTADRKSERSRADSRERDSHQTGTATVDRRAALRNDGPGAGSPSRRFLGKLVPCGGGELLPLLQESLTVGRSRSCDLTIRSATISSEHCRLQFLDGFWTVEDLNSSNGVRVDSLRVRQKVLMPGCTLSIAKHRYSVEYAPEGALPPEVDVPYVEGAPDGRPNSGSLLKSIGLDQRAIAEKPPAWLAEPDDPPTKAKYRLDDNDP